MSPGQLAALSLSAVTSLKDRFIHGRVLRAATLSMGSQFVSQILRLGGNLIMTRLLAPEAFGLMSLVAMIQVILALISDIGLRPAIIQSRNGDDPDFLNTAWTIQIIRGFGMWGASLVIAVGIGIGARYGVFEAGTAYASPQLPLLLVVVALGSIVSGFQSTNHITASRNLALGRVILLEGMGQIFGLICMVVLGLLTRSIWALVAAGLASQLLVTVLSHSYLPGIANRFCWNRKAVDEIVRFGMWVLASSLAYVLAVNSDRALLGALVSASVLGVYAIALNLSMVVDNLMSRLYEGVILPALSEGARQTDELLRQRLMRLRLPFDIWFLAAAGGMFALGPSVVALLYDARYHDAGRMLQILSFSLVGTRFGIFNVAYLAKQRPQYTALTNMVRLIAVAISIPVAFELWGIDGAVWAIALHPLAVLPFYYWFNRKLGLNDFKHEIMVLPAWAAGYFAGVVLLALIGAVFA